MEETREQWNHRMHVAEHIAAQLNLAGENPGSVGTAASLLTLIRTAARDELMKSIGDTKLLVIDGLLFMDIMNLLAVISEDQQERGNFVTANLCRGMLERCVAAGHIKYENRED